MLRHRRTRLMEHRLRNGLTIRILIQVSKKYKFTSETVEQRECCAVVHQIAQIVSFSLINFDRSVDPMHEGPTGEEANRSYRVISILNNIE